MTDGDPSPNPRNRSAATAIAFVVVGIVAFVAWLAAGLLVGLGMVVTPEPGKEGAVLVLRLLLVSGWLACLAWLVRSLRKWRVRFIFAPVAAWIWVYLVILVLGRNAFLNWGY